MEAAGSAGAEPDEERLRPPPEASVGNPLFARMYALMARKEPPHMVDRRRQLLSGLAGRVLELGAGSGANFAHYPASVAEVLAVEPEPYLRDKALKAAVDAAVAVTVIEATADLLPVEDGSCDAAVACLVLCSVPSQPAALAELRRVVRRGGELRFYEHVLSPKASVARSQRFVDRLFWPRAFGGCHTARDTGAAIAATGWAVESEQRLWEPPCAVAVPVGEHLLGVARRT
ncbi:MAG: class I SAM-dependent methyltransferase [Thermoleophilaceae bacterium]